LLCVLSSYSLLPPLYFQFPTPLLMELALIDITPRIVLINANSKTG
jgi:hypothetical protein